MPVWSHARCCGAVMHRRSQRGLSGSLCDTMPSRCMGEASNPGQRAKGCDLIQEAVEKTLRLSRCASRAPASAAPGRTR